MREHRLTELAQVLGVLVEGVVAGEGLEVAVHVREHEADEDDAARAISIFRAIVVRDARAPFTSEGGLSSGCHGHATAARDAATRRGCDVCPVRRGARFRCRRDTRSSPCAPSVQTQARLPDQSRTSWRCMASTDARRTRSDPARIEARTLRTDRWWLTPLATFVVFSAFVVYATVRAFMGATTSPSPTCRRSTRRASATASRAPRTSASRSQWWPLSAALIILIFPLGFRMTCYYYRKAYYRAFWLSPPACAVAEPHRLHRRDPVPAVLQNLHRYFWYAAVVVGLVLTYDVVLAFRPMPASTPRRRGDQRHPHGPRHGADARQRRPHLALHAVLPLLPPHRRRPAAPLLQAPGPLPAVDLGVEAQRPATPRAPGTPCSPSRSSTSTSTCSPPA